MRVEVEVEVEVGFGVYDGQKDGEVGWQVWRGEGF